MRLEVVRLEVVRLEVVRVEVLRVDVGRLKVVRDVVFVVFAVDFVLLMVVFEEVLAVVTGDSLIGFVVTMARLSNAATCSSGSPSKTVTSLSVETTLFSSTGEMGNAATVRRSEERIRFVNFMFRDLNSGCLACSSPVRQGH